MPIQHLGGSWGFELWSPHLGSKYCQAVLITKLSPQPVGCVVFVVWVLSFETGSSYIPETGSPSASESCVLGSQEHHHTGFEAGFNATSLDPLDMKLRISQTGGAGWGQGSKVNGCWSVGYLTYRPHWLVWWGWLDSTMQK